MSNAPQTEDEYLRLCSGYPNKAGTGPMTLKNMQICYCVDAQQLSVIIEEAAQFFMSDPGLEEDALGTNNGGEWRAAKSELNKWLTHKSTWATDALFGSGNSIVPEPCKKEAMLRIATNARKQINKIYHSPVKQESAYSEPSYRRSAANSPARSLASGTTNLMRTLDIGELTPEEMPYIPDIRTSVICFDDPTGALIKRITMKNLVEPTAYDDREKLLTSMDVVYRQLLAAAATATHLDEAELLLSFNGDKISNQHELEAAVNDFANGVRQGTRFAVVVSQRETEQDLAIAQVPAPQANPGGIPLRATPVPNVDVEMPDADRTRSGYNANSGGGLDGRTLQSHTASGGELGGRTLQSHTASGGSKHDGRTSNNKNTPTAKAVDKRRKEGETPPATPKSDSPRGAKEKKRKSRGTSESETSQDSTESDSDDPKLVGALPTLEDVVNPDVESEDDVDDAEGALYQYLQDRFSEAGAGTKAMRVHPEEWKSASDTFGVTLAQLRGQHTAANRFLPIDPDLGLSPSLGLMAHQVVGADVIHNMNFGPQRGCIEQDHMGMGKTIQVMCAFFLNLVLTHEANEGTLLPPTQRLRLDPEKLYKGRSPRVGATFLSAYSNGVEPWPRDWLKIVKDSPIMAQTEEWRPKMILLHESGARLCQAYGGAENGLYSELTMADLVEMLPRPDWEKARAAYYFPFDLSTGVDGEKVKYIGEPNRSVHTRSTKSQPSPTSARFFVVSTNKCWQSRVYDVVNENFKAASMLKTQISKTNVLHTGKIRDLQKQFRDTVTKKMKGGGDGRQKNQVTRRAHWADWKGEVRKVDMISDLFYAAWIIVDEIHSASSAGTLTYSVIIDPFNRFVPDASLRPAFTAITGTAMANGVVTVLTFALKGLKREDPAWQALPDAAVGLLKTLDYKEVMNAWEKFTKAPAAELRKPIAERLKGNSQLESILNVVAAIIATYFVGRDYESVDAWGQKLNLLDCTLDDRYMAVIHLSEYRLLLKDVEDNIQSHIASTHAAAVAKWEDEGGELSSKPRPKKPNASKVAPGLYQKAKVLASYPNFERGVLQYQKEHPDEEALIGPRAKWGDDLGKENILLNDILSSPQKIINSVLYKAIDYICLGSAKSDIVMQKAKKTSKRWSIAPNPEAGKAGQPATISYRAKYCLVSSVRVCKAIAYARMVKEFGAEHIAWVGDGAPKETEVAKWRKYFNYDTGTVDDSVQFMVAGLKMVCQAIDLVEGSVFQGLEPHSINAEARQVGYRGYRIGQKADRVTLDWLVHKGSFVEETTWARNELKNNFADTCRRADIAKTKLAAEAADAEATRQAAEAADAEATKEAAAEGIA